MASCGGEQEFYGGENSGFHYKYDNNYLILSYNYIDNRFNQSGEDPAAPVEIVNEPNCWKISITGGHDLASMDVNITYHNPNATSEGLQNFYSPDGYTDSSSFSRGIGTLAEIELSDLMLENESSYVVGNQIDINNKKSENLVILIHGWNPQGSKNKFAPNNDTCFPDNGNTPEDLQCGWNLLYKNLVDRVGHDWTIARYDWSEDAASGSIDWPDDIISANEARDRSHVHGLRLGKIIKKIQPKQVQFIAHSAGTWMARRASDYLKTEFGNGINVQVTMLDAYVNDSDPTIDDLNLESAFEITEKWLDFSENYFVYDFATDNYFGSTSGCLFRLGHKLSIGLWKPKY